MTDSATALEATVKPVESSNSGPGEFELILSKDNLDRDGEHLWAADWKELPARVHFDTDHQFSKGQSVPFTAGSGVPEINENGDLIVRGTYAGTEHGQLVRQLVNEGHIWQASVAYAEHEDDDGNITRELLNGTFTGVPSNPEAVIMSSKAADKKPYGNVTYADPGYQEDGKARYPIDNEAHVRAALSYFGQAKNRSQYSASQQRTILGRIHSAARRFGIDVSDGDTKSLIFAFCKAVVLANTKAQDLGASSVYDDAKDDDADSTEDEEDAEDDAAQAVHDAAVALGAECSSANCKGITGPTGTVIDGLISTKTLPPADETTAAADKAAAAVSPADLAAARTRKFMYEANLREMEI